MQDAAKKTADLFAFPGRPRRLRRTSMGGCPTRRRAVGALQVVHRQGARRGGVPRVDLPAAEALPRARRTSSSSSAPAGRRRRVDEPLGPQRQPCKGTSSRSSARELRRLLPEVERPAVRGDLHGRGHRRRESLGRRPDELGSTARTARRGGDDHEPAPCRPARAGRTSTTAARTSRSTTSSSSFAPTNTLGDEFRALIETTTDTGRQAPAGHGSTTGSGTSGSAAPSSSAEHRRSRPG